MRCAPSNAEVKKKKKTFSLAEQLHRNERAVILECGGLVCECVCVCGGGRGNGGLPDEPAASESAVLAFLVVFGLYFVCVAVALFVTSTDPLIDRKPEHRGAFLLASVFFSPTSHSRTIGRPHVETEATNHSRAGSRHATSRPPKEKPASGICNIPQHYSFLFFLFLSNKLQPC